MCQKFLHRAFALQIACLLSPLNSSRLRRNLGSLHKPQNMIRYHQESSFLTPSHVLGSKLQTCLTARCIRSLALGLKAVALIFASIPLAFCFSPSKPLLPTSSTTHFLLKPKYFSP